MAATFNGQAIFGTQTAVTGPTSEYRTQKSIMPGIAGERLYGLGKSNWQWTITGRLTSSTKAGIASLIQSGVALQNGTLYAFADDQGGTYTNCQLVSFAPAGPMTPCGNGNFTITIQATVKWLSPT